MRNIFHQYTHAENRLTHALFSALDQNRVLLASFIKDQCRTQFRTKATDLSISVQQHPGGAEYSEAEAVARGVPDAWIYDNDGLALVFEAKITARLTTTQLKRHQRIAARYGFDQVKCFTIVATETTGEVDGWTQLRWVDIYGWLRKQEGMAQVHGTNWAKIAADYFEILEENLLSLGKINEHKITTFSGFFSSESEYDYVMAKNRIKTAMRELRKNQRLVTELSIDPIAEGRGAITGKEADSVWDIMRLVMSKGSVKFTEFPHLTLGVGRRDARAMVTFPNALRPRSRQHLLSGGLDSFSSITRDILTNMNAILVKEPHARPLMRAVQRRWPSRMSQPFLDATLDFDLRTAFPDGATGPRLQPQWISALFAALSDKQSNLEFQIGVSFAYDRCKSMKSASALDLIADGWIACKPMIKLAII